MRSKRGTLAFFKEHKKLSGSLHTSVHFSVELIFIFCLFFTGTRRKTWTSREQRTKRKEGKHCLCVLEASSAFRLQLKSNNLSWFCFLPKGWFNHIHSDFLFNDNTYMDLLEYSFLNIFRGRGVLWDALVRSVLEETSANQASRGWKVPGEREAHLWVFIFCYFSCCVWLSD